MSLAATRINEMVARNPSFYSNEIRLAEWGALDFFVQETNRAGGAVTREMQTLAERSIGSQYQIPVLKHTGAVQLLSQRTCEIPCAPSSSEMLNVDFVTLGFGMCMNPDEYHNNRISYQEDFDFKFRGGADALGQKMDELCVTKLDSYKTQVIGNTLDYPFAGNIISSSFNKRMDVLTDSGIMMKSNRYTRTPLHVIGNSGVESLIAQQMKLGSSNAIDFTMEYANKQFHITENIVNDANQFATFFAMEPGNVGMLYRFPRVALNNRQALGRSWEIINLPILNIPVALQYYREWNDLSAVETDMTCDLVEKFGFYVDFAIVTKYVSDPATIATPDIKVQIAGSPQDGSGVPVQVTNIVQTQAVP